jgi:hypothetical protein
METAKIGRCQERITLKSALTCSSALFRFCALVQLVLEGTRRVLRDRMLSVFSDDDSGSFSAQELKLRMDNATSYRAKTKKIRKCKLKKMIRCAGEFQYWIHIKSLLWQTLQKTFSKKCPETYNSLSARNKKGSELNFKFPSIDKSGLLNSTFSDVIIYF